jgi:peroxiredoxin
MRFMGCGICKYDMHILSRDYGQFQALGAQVLVIMQSPEKTVLRETQSAPIPFDIVCDPDCVIYDALDVQATGTKEERLPKSPEGIALLEYKKKELGRLGLERGESEGRSEQLPAIFIIDRSLRVLHAHYAENSVDMPSPGEAADIIKHLGEENWGD